MATVKNTFIYYGRPGPVTWHNPAIEQVLVGAKMRGTVQRVGGKAVGLFKARAPRRSGALARSAKLSAPRISGANELGKGISRRWFVEAVSGEGRAYGAAVDFGRRNWSGVAKKDTARNLTKRGTVRKRKPGKTKAAHTWREVIRAMEAS